MVRATQTQPRSESAGLLVDTLAYLWPGSEVSFVRRGGHLDGRSFVAVPSMRSPRLLVPASRAAAATALARFPAALSKTQAAARAAAASLVRRGANRYASPRLVVRDGQNGIDEYFANLLGRQVELSVGIGTARINQKPVLGVFTPEGLPLGYAKIGSTPYTSSLVAAEGEALSRLRDHHWSTFSHPEPVDVGVWNGAKVLFMSYVPTTWWRVGTRRSAAEYIAPEMVDRLGSGTCSLIETSLWARLSRSAETAPDGVAGERLRAALDILGKTWGEHTVRSSGWHGDLTPWNVSWSGSHAQVWDWERFEVGVPDGLDVLHWKVRAGGKENRPAEIVASLASAPADIPIAVKATYLVTMAERYIGGGNLGSDRALVLLDALDLLRRGS